MTHTTQTEPYVIEIQTSHPVDWPELALTVMRHVEQAAHESGPCPAHLPRMQQVRLEIPSNWPLTAVLKTRIHQLFEAIHQGLAQELSVATLKVVTHRSMQSPRLVLTGFDTNTSSKAHKPKHRSYI